jgi:predicted TIM-barrel fold metal-dependent hydrolase
MKKSEPELEPESPIPFHPCSNGEAPPRPRTEQDRQAEALYRRIVEEKAPRLGMSRRDFTQSACGWAAAMFVANQVYGCGGKGSGSPAGSGGAGGGGSGGAGGFTRDAGYDVAADVSARDAAQAAADARSQVDARAMEDQAQAEDMLRPPPDDFVFDVQTHNRVAKPPWVPNSVCPPGRTSTPMQCPSDWIQEIFVGGDTTVACLSGFPAPRANDAPSIEARKKIKDIVDELSGSPRMVIHANVRPIEGKAELDAMEMDLRSFPVAAWKIYPEAKGLDTDDVGRPFIERARQLGVKVIAAHRGLTGDGSWNENVSPRDVAVAAKASPDVSFLVYHGGFQSVGQERAPFNPANASPQGVDRLIKAALDNGLGPTGNLYAELGSTWNAIKDDVAAAHVLGKLLKYLGPERILWGTDSVLTGSPREQIVKFRAFEIPASMQMLYGYPALTPEVKRKILGLNAARVYGVDPAIVRRKITSDDISKIKLARREDPRAFPLPPPSRGPRTWREWLWFKRSEGVEA